MNSGMYTMKNYGHRRNCSLSVMYPVNVQFVNVDVGQTGAFPGHVKETGTKVHVGLHAVYNTAMASISF